MTAISPRPRRAGPTLLPPNATAVERAVDTAGSVALDLPTPLTALWDPDTCPVELLPWLAWGLGVKGWSAEWPEHIKRARIKAAIAIARRQGTRASVREVIESFGGAVLMREWFETVPAGPRHTFDLVVSLAGDGGEPATAAYVEAVVAEVERVKPARSHFTFSQAVSAVAALRAATGVRTATFARVELAAK